MFPRIHTSQSQAHILGTIQTNITVNWIYSVAVYNCIALHWSLHLWFNPKPVISVLQNVSLLWVPAAWPRYSWKMFAAGPVSFTNICRIRFREFNQLHFTSFRGSRGYFCELVRPSRVRHCSEVCWKCLIGVFANNLYFSTWSLSRKFPCRWQHRSGSGRGCTCPAGRRPGRRRPPPVSQPGPGRCSSLADDPADLQVTTDPNLKLVLKKYWLCLERIFIRSVVSSKP